MRKIIIASIIGIIGIGVLSSCNKSKTYAQRLDDEQENIEQFIDQNDITVLREYPEDSVFQENEFYFDTSSGIYYNVIDTGKVEGEDKGRRIKNGEQVYIRFKGLKYIASSDTATYSNINELQPEVLVYGNPATYTSVAWVAPLENVGNRAKVKMIVPFNMGMPTDQQQYRTAYYQEIDYRFEL